jgi:GH25 family lysozyme M1 (1,4-beta-N-acetylmuramidase)
MIGLKRRDGMNINFNKGSNRTQEYQYSEDRLNHVKKKKKGKAQSALIILGYLVALILVMYVASLINTWVTDKLEDSAKQMAVSVGAELLPEDKEVTLTEAELNAKVEEAAQNAAEEAASAAEQEKEQAVADARAEILDGIRAGLETGDNTMVEVLRPYYPDDIVVVSNGKFCFVPINRELKLNSYDEENLNILESGEYQYLDGEQVISHKGIDVSKFQGDIDWEAVAQDGVEFVFVRVANRGYGTGKLVEDEKFEKNIKGALDAGLHVGVYLYSQAITEDEVLEEAKMVLDKIAPYEIDCPIVYDVEKTVESAGRMNQLSVEERTNLTLLFCQTIEAAGYKPMIYHNVEMGALMLDIETLEGYDKWLAYYNDDMYYPYDYRIWQYSDKGSVNGIKGQVDFNISFDAFWEE